MKQIIGSRRGAEIRSLYSLRGALFGSREGAKAQREKGNVSQAAPAIFAKENCFNLFAPPCLRVNHSSFSFWLGLVSQQPQQSPA
jgi:hypothetical protein